MAPVMPYLSNFSFIPGTPITIRKNSCLARCGVSRKSSKQTLCLQKYILPLSSSARLFPSYKRVCERSHKSQTHVLSAAETDVAVEETGSPVVDEASTAVAEVPPSGVGTSEKSASKAEASSALAQSKRTRPVRKSEMPPVKNEELVPGATFTGKVRSVQPFGAFIDFGAFTDGLVHVSRLSDSYVKDVGKFVSVGQEVKVKLVEANIEAGRISLTMRESDDAPNSGDKPRPAARNTSKPRQNRDDVKTSKFNIGQELKGTVKNLTRSGAFISFPEGGEGFLPTSEESDDGLGSMLGGSTLEVGQEVDVRVLRISRGSATLTMKKAEDAQKLDSELAQFTIGNHVATNPFLLAFRKNKDIAEFLDERDELEKTAQVPATPNVPEEITGQGTPAETVSDVPELEDQSEASTERVASVVEETIEDGPSKGEDIGTDVSSSTESELGAVQTIEEAADESSEILSPEGSISTGNGIAEEVPSSLETVDGAVETVEETTKSAETLASEEGVSTENEISGKEAPSSSETVDDAVETVEETTKSAETLASEENVSTENKISGEESPSESLKGEVTENEVSDTQAEDTAQAQALTTENEIPSADVVQDSEAEQVPEENGSITSSSVLPDIPQESKDGSSDSSESKDIKEAVENQVENAKDEVQVQTLIAESEIPSASQVEAVEPVLAANSYGDIGDASTIKNETKAATISPALVKQLREETGAGMMDCKKALSETGGDLAKAQEFLRKKGLSSADKKASRTTAEGRIGSYIHDSRIGVLVEVNCETDFVARGDIFKELVDDLAMQVAASPRVEYLVPDDVPEEIVNKEKEIEMQKEDLLSKPEQIRSKIVEGRIRKRLEELALLEQPFIKNDKVVVKDFVKQTIATIGENIKVKRFVRYNLGEGLEKKSQDFAAQVAAQTAAKPATTSNKEQPPAAEVKEAVEKPQTVAVSAALVKQLREETGSGMMDCKKALSETGGDLEKAQEYLRKKGLSTADKKSSRLAAEGRIGSYIHDSRIGVLIEVNCETDFVGRSEKFKELVDDLAMQVVACPQVQYVSTEDIPQSIVDKEREIEMQREDLKSKPENIKEKIVEGRISKRLGELALLEQPFIKDDSVLIKDLVKQSVAAIGENIKVRRFVRFTLGETAEDNSTETEV